MINAIKVMKFDIIGNAGDSYALLHARENSGGSII